MPSFERFRVRPGRRPRLSRRDPAYHGSFREAAARQRVEWNIGRLHQWQNRLWAEHKRAVLIVLQGLDTSGKDGTITHVMGGPNPLGVQVVSFKAPTAEELDHDFLWRIHHLCPRRGEIRIFNRSHYEDVLVPRVDRLVPREVWRDRYRRIADFEDLLTVSGTVVLKFFLHISRDEQRRRLQARLTNPEKRWKFQVDDLKTREKWDEYMAAYEDALERCSTTSAPWYVVPADHKWFRNLVVSEIIADRLETMAPRFPEPSPGLDRVRIPL
jgi:PPK2 family polyphosphate:nucleotide phosphotransferase